MNKSSIGRRLISAWLFIAALPAPAAPSGGADTWSALRSRPGNDDLFIMVDTSMSMSAGMNGMMDRVRPFLSDFLLGYTKVGDRVILMTFDSEASVRGVIEIVDDRRDRPLLESMVRSLDSRRIIYWSGRYPNFREVARGEHSAMGGGQWTDYCEMWRVATAAVSTFADSKHRQVFLLFTDGEPDAPGYRACGDPGVRPEFAFGLTQERFRMGVFALPTGDRSADDLADALETMFRGMPGASEIAARNGLKILVVDREGPGSSHVVRDLIDLINSRVDLMSPDNIDLGSTYRPELDATFVLQNQSKARRAVALESVTLDVAGSAPIPIPFAPKAIAMEPGEHVNLRIGPADLALPPGEWGGTLRVSFSTASRFDPDSVSFRVRSLSWWEAYGWYVQTTVWVLVTLMFLVVAIVAASVLARYGPAEVEATYSGGAERVHARAMVACGDRAPFGSGTPVDGVLMVSERLARNGILSRAGADVWMVSWDGVRYDPCVPGFPTYQPDGNGSWVFEVRLPRIPTLHAVAAWWRVRRHPGL